MNKKIYIVECSRSSYDDAVSWIAGVFTNYEDAEQAASKFTLAAEIILANAPIELDLPYIDPLYKINAVLCYNYWKHYKLYEEFQSANIKEFILNEPDNLTDPYNGIK